MATALILIGWASGNCASFSRPKDLGQGIAPGELEEAIFLERIDRDVEPVDPGSHQRFGVALEQVAVGGHAEVVDLLDVGEHAREPWEIPSDQRLAAGQSDVMHAHRREKRDQPRDLLEREDLLAVQPGQALGRHAVLAAEVAAVGDRHAQIADRSAVTVFEWFERHRTRA